MTFDMVWGPQALAVFYNLHPHEAMAVDRAVIRFAEMQRPRAEKIGPHYRLTVGSLCVQFSLVRETGTMNVLYLYRVR